MSIYGVTLQFINLFTTMGRDKKMKKGFLAAALFAMTLVLFGTANAGDWIAEDMFVAPEASIVIDGDAADWGMIEPLTAVEFKTTADEWVVFEEYDGGIWNGPDDHTTSVAFAWDSDALYVYILVVDDEHEHQSDGFWAGDAVQMAFADGDRTAHTQLYNFYLSEAGATVIANEMATAGGQVDGDVVAVRDEGTKTTFYEAKFTPEILGLSSLEVDMKIGVGICVNDGDLDTPGQKGWSGWGPHALVHGKNGDKTGLVTLGASAAVSPASKAAVTWGELK